MLLARRGAREGLRQGPRDPAGDPRRSCATPCSRRRARASPRPQRYPAPRRSGLLTRRTRPTSTIPSGAACRPSSCRPRRRRAPCSRRLKGDDRPRSGASSCARKSIDPQAKANVPGRPGGRPRLRQPAGRPARRQRARARGGARRGLQDRRTSATCSPRVVPAGGKFYVVKLDGQDRGARPHARGRRAHASASSWRRTSSRAQRRGAARRAPQAVPGEDRRGGPRHRSRSTCRVDGGADAR